MAANLTEWKSKAERAAKALARLREATESAVVHVRHDAEVVGAGVVAGAIRGAFEATGKDYSIPIPGAGMSIPPEYVGGGLLLALAFSDQTQASADFHSAGSGILSFIGGLQARDFMRDREERKQQNGKP